MPVHRHDPFAAGDRRVKHERIHIIADGKAYSPPYSYGVDSSRVLEEIMDAEPRTKKVKELLSEISRAIGNERYGDAHELLVDLSDRVGENDPEVIRVRTLLDFMTGDL